jgi:plastocyanin
MGARIRGAVWLAIAAGALLAAAIGASGAAAAPTTANYVAYDATGNRDEFRWQTADGATDVTVEKGGTVTFSNGNFRPHNVDFGPDAGISCQLAGGVASTEPMPELAERNWSGTCSFPNTGSYRFICDLHPAMLGTVKVEAPSAPSPGPSPGTGGGGTSPGPTGGSAPGSPPVTTTGPSAGTTPGGSAGDQLGLPGRQSGGRVRASVLVQAPLARVIAVVRARRADLGLKRKRGRIEVAQFVRAGVAPGALEFSARLRKGARKALRAKGSLVVRVRVTISADGATDRTWTRTVTLRAR